RVRRVLPDRPPVGAGAGRRLGDEGEHGREQRGDGECLAQRAEACTSPIAVLAGHPASFRFEPLAAAGYPASDAGGIKSRTLLSGAAPGSRPRYRRAVLVVSRTEVERLLDLDELIDALAAAHAGLSAGRASMPARIAAVVPEREGVLIAMPAHLPS